MKIVILKYSRIGEPMANFLWRKLGVVAVVAVLLGLASCEDGEGRKPTFSVTGKVLYLDGKPAENAIVVFHPVGDATADVLKPRGKVGADGSFKLTSYDGDDGAPAGQYRVTVELWLNTGKGDEGPTSRLNPKYAKPETSGLTATVTAGSNELKPFEVKK